MRPLVRVVDDEKSVRESRKFVLNLAGFEVACYESGEEFLEKDDLRRPGCIILDLSMPGISGLEVQSELIQKGVDLPVIFVTGHGEVNAAVLALKRGAFDFLEKPVSPDKLQECVTKLISFDQIRRKRASEFQALQKRYLQLSFRERSVAKAVAKGTLNKVIAAELGIAEQTVKIHRANIFQKLGIRNAVDLAEIIRALQEEKREPSGVKSSYFLSEEKQR